MVREQGGHVDSLESRWFVSYHGANPEIFLFRRGTCSMVVVAGW